MALAEPGAIKVLPLTPVLWCDAGIMLSSNGAEWCLFLLSVWHGDEVVNWRKRIRWIVLYPALILAGFHTLGTGSPIPLWHIEHLNAPVLVQSITETHLYLEDGRKITLPLIKELPHDNPLFRAAISNGIEVGTSGQVYGLMWSDRSCGNDPFVWRRLRVDLSILAGALNPVGIDDTHVHPDVIAFIQENHRIDLSVQSRSHRNLHLSGWDWTRLRSVRKEMEHAQAN